MRPHIVPAIVAVRVVDGWKCCRLWEVFSRWLLADACETFSTLFHGQLLCLYSLYVYVHTVTARHFSTAHCKCVIFPSTQHSWSSEKYHWVGGWMSGWLFCQREFLESINDPNFDCMCRACGGRTLHVHVCFVFNFCIFFQKNAQNSIFS